jgi:sortase A
VRNFFAWLLVIVGLVIVYLGVRQVWKSHTAQQRAAAEWSRQETQSKAKPPAPIPPAPVKKPTRLLPGESVGRLSIPRLGASLYVVEGSEKEDLENGPGHVVGTALPGPTGNCAIAGHRDTVFRQLRNIKVGDEVVVETHQAAYHYRVSATQIILPTNIQCLLPTPSAELHLITCYPFYFVGNAPKRFVVTAPLERVDNVAQQDSKPDHPPA